jgi:integrase
MCGFMIYDMKRNGIACGGCAFEVVSELLGHSSVAITADIYAHVLPEMQQEVVNKMGDLYGRS